MKIIERKVQEIGKSLLVTLPKSWSRIANVKKGSGIKMIVRDNGSLSIAPEFAKEDEKKEEVIEYDEHFKRRFFRDYFDGNEKIVIRLRNISSKEKLELHDFLKRFMNAQIVEENSEKIVIKCFNIEELSIIECLNRMFFLSLGMFEYNKETKEIRDNMTKFYYMLVMQVRRFLSEGKFANENQISLIRATDIRMVAEKIQRIGEIAKSSKEKELTKEVVEYYSNSFYCFINESFEKALPLWKQGNLLMKKCEKLKENDLKQIARFSKEISMLVR